MQSFQKFHFIPDPGYHCYHCPPSNTGSPDCLRQLILVKRGNQPSLYPFLEDLSQLSDTSKYSHHHCAQEVSAKVHPGRKKSFILCTICQASHLACYLNWGGRQTSKKQSPFQVYTTPNPWKSSRETLLLRESTTFLLPIQQMHKLLTSSKHFDNWTNTVIQPDAKERICSKFEPNLFLWRNFKLLFFIQSICNWVLGGPAVVIQLIPTDH